MKLPLLIEYVRVREDRDGVLHRSYIVRDSDGAMVNMNEVLKLLDALMRVLDAAKDVRAYIGYAIDVDEEKERFYAAIAAADEALANDL